MEIYINNQKVVLKKGTSFEYVAENRLFSGSDGYTLSITFPLRGCRENLKIFGNINRQDVIARKVIFDCEIRHRNFYKAGSITLTEISDVEVKVQFLEGRSEQNFDETFDKIYINELDLGTSAGGNDSTPENAWDPARNGNKFVALPWVNDASGNIQNLADFIVDDAVQRKGHYQWNEDCRGRSWQPYLLYITKKICEAVGYRYDFSKWEEKEEYRYLLICNTLPYAWDTNEFARALPHWSVAEYFEKLELFFNGEFTIDHRAKTINFAFAEAVVGALEPICLDKIISEHTVEVTVEDDTKCEYQEMKNLVYKECGHEMWKFYSCDWFIKDRKPYVVEYNTMMELLNANKTFRTWNGSNSRGSNRNKVLYAKDINAYFIIRSLSKTLVEARKSPMLNLYAYKMELRPINIFGGRIIDDREDADQIEIEFVPAWIDETEDKYGRCLFLSFAGFNEPEQLDASYIFDRDARKKEIDDYLFQPQALQQLVAGEKDKKAEYYDCIYMAWWDGTMDSFTYGRLPHPYVEDIEIAPDWGNYRNLHFSMRINRPTAMRKGTLHKIDPKQKTTFKFLSDTIPNPRSLFHIKGKRYICEKITATFTENGMSELMKGVFYPLPD